MIMFLSLIFLLIFDVFCWRIILMSKEEREQHAYRRLKRQAKAQTSAAGMQYDKREIYGKLYLFLAWGMAITTTLLILLILLGMILRYYFPK